MKKITETTYDLMGYSEKTHSISMSLEDARNIRDVLGKLSRSMLEDVGVSPKIPAHDLYFNLDEVIGE